ncbi:MAG: cytochrome c [Paracoccaceae bacterium]
MKTALSLFTGLTLATVVATSALADGHANKALMGAVKARKATMQLYAFNIGILGAMAKGDVEYNADAASAAATNLATLSSMNQMALWPPGSDNGALGDATGALPAIWADGSKVGEAGMAMATASASLAAVAGDGLDALRGGIGAVGKSCGGCHDTYRQPQ